MDIKANANTNLRFLNAKSFMAHFTTNVDGVCCKKNTVIKH